MKAEGQRLHHVRVQHFRSLYDVSLTLKPLNIIIGPNASGKSNLFKALRFLYNAIAGDRLEWQAYDAQVDDLLWYGLDENGERPTTLTLALGFEGRASYESTFKCDDYIQVVKERLRVPLDSHQEVIPFFERDKNTVKHFVGRRGGKLKQPHYGRVRSSRTLHLREEGPNLTVAPARGVYEHVNGWRFLDISPQKARRPAFIPQYPEEVPPLAGDGSNLSAFLYALSRLRPDDLAFIVETMADWVEFPQNLLVEHDAERGGRHARYHFIEQPFGENRLIPPESMSDGTIRLLTLLALLLADRTVSLACIEEPTRGLHPRLMLYLADVLRQTVESGPQVVVVTHSPDFMDCFDLAAEADYLQVYVAERDEEGKTQFLPTTAQDLAPWLEKYRLGEAVRRHFV